jgi:hypothetical protein
VRAPTCGRALIAVYDDGSGAVWPLDIDAWKRHACAVAGRNLTGGVGYQLLACEAPPAMLAT